MGLQLSAQDSRRWLLAKNDSGEDTPGMSIVRITGTVIVDGEVAYKFAKPNADSADPIGASIYAVVAPVGIKSGKHGRITMDWPALVRFTSTAPMAGELVGTSNEAWTVSRSRVGFVSLGQVDTTAADITLVVPERAMLLAKANENIASGASGTFSVYLGTAGEEADTGIDVTAWNHFAAVTYGDFVVLGAPNNNQWYVMPAGSPGAVLVRFRTTATLALGGEADAVILTWNGASYDEGAAIVVTDSFLPGRWSAVNGAEGIAVKLPDQDGYDILWIEHQSIFATATLTANMTAGTAACTFTDTWQGPSGVGVGGQVYDVDGRYAGLLTGDKVLACWDDVESKYKICDGPRSQLKWAYATADWVNGALNTSKVVCEAATGKDGASAGGGTFDVWLPRPSGSLDPNVRQGNIVVYMLDEAGLRIAVTGYLDDCIKTIKVWGGTAADIRPGWRLCDGFDGTPDLREKFVVGAYGDSGGDPNFDAEIVDGVLIPGGSTNVGNTGGKNRKLTNWKHTRFGEEQLVTNSTELAIRQTNNFRTLKEDPPLTVSATGTATVSGNTDYALAKPIVIDPTSETTQHPEHTHEQIKLLGVLGITGYQADDGGPRVANCTGPVQEDNCGGFLTLDHVVVEPGQSSGGFMHPIQTGNPPPNDIPAGKTGHRHAFDNIVINASSFNFKLNWGESTYTGHHHWVQAGAADYAFTIYDATHGFLTAVHFHSLFLDNHQEWINRIPPYYALCYIMRVN